MTIVLKDNKNQHELHNITFVGKSNKKDCDYCAIDTFKHEFHFSHLQLIAIRG